MGTTRGRGGTPGGAETRDRIVRAAEELFARHGIDGVSLREITRVAGQANTAAVQYYFGDRTGLVLAVIERHRRDDELRRHTLLDAYEQHGREDLTALAAALVTPLAAKLADADGGRHYLQISAEHYLRASSDELRGRRITDTSFERWTELLRPLVPPAEDELPSRFSAVRFTLMELARRAAAPPRSDDRLFTSHLIDMVAALLGTLPSATTARLLGQAGSARSRAAT